MSISNLIGIIIVFGVIYILYKKGIIKNIRYPVIKYKFTFDHRKNGKLLLSYGKYNGVSNYPFFLKPGQSTELHYDVKVEEGSVELTLNMGKKVVFNKEFEKNEKGKISFVPENSTSILVVTGKYTKGGCNVQLLATNEIKEPVNK